MTRACFRCSDSGVGNKKSVFLLISLCTVQPIIARYHEIRCSPPIIAPYLHIRISNLPYPSYPYIQLAISFMSSYVSYPYIRNAISLIFSYPYITASHSLLSWYPRVEQTYLRNTLISASLILACVASVSARVRLENRDESKQGEWSGRGEREGNFPLFPSPFDLPFLLLSQQREWNRLLLRQAGVFLYLISTYLASHIALSYNAVEPPTRPPLYNGHFYLSRRTVHGTLTLVLTSLQRPPLCNGNSATKLCPQLPR